mgnify:FL=1|tara:strand:+ start:755 stop:1294 length:540 start_codon:yes stop_codon:yes gene_type:complete
MSEETKNVASETVSEQPTQETPASSPDDGALIAESKKYRKRAQDAEARIAEMEKKMAKAEEAKLKEKEDFKALYEKVASENETLSSVADKWTKYEETRRASLLEKHPEEDRESLQGLPLDTLEFVTNKINGAKANAPEVIGNPRGFKEAPKDWTKLSPSELRENWEDIVKSAEARMKKN